MGFNSLTTTTHPPTSNFHLQGSKLPLGLSARKVSVAGGNRAQDPLVRDTTLVQQHAMAWIVWGSNLNKSEIFHTYLDWP